MFISAWSLGFPLYSMDCDVTPVIYFDVQNVFHFSVGRPFNLPTLSAPHVPLFSEHLCANRHNDCFTVIRYPRWSSTGLTHVSGVLPLFMRNGIEKPRSGVRCAAAAHTGSPGGVKDCVWCAHACVHVERAVHTCLFRYLCVAMYTLTHEFTPIPSGPVQYHLVLPLLYL